MASLIGRFDWASTALGPMAHWPPHLRTAVGITLHSPKPITLLWGDEGTMIYNDAYAIIAGGRHPACLGQPLRHAWPEVAEFNDGLLRTVLNGEARSFLDHPFTFLRNGVPEAAWLTLDYSPVPDATGRIAGVMAVVTETTEKMVAERALRETNRTLEAEVRERTDALLQAQEALRQAQKMEAIGQLTGGIAHDFNNLLGALKMGLEVLERRLEAGDASQAQRYIGMSKQTVARAAALTHRLLAFSRRQTLDPQRIDLQRWLPEIEQLVQRTVGPAIDVRSDVAPDLWAVRADAAQIENALINLCINARDAMLPDGGELCLLASNETLSAVDAPWLETAPGDYVCIRVQDFGCGMDVRTVAHAAEPFFTTKPLGQGTGLGLSMVYGFVRQSGGQLRIESVPGEGTTVSIYLPRFDGDPPQPDAEPAEDEAHAVLRQAARVLLIEDEATIRALIEEELLADGFQVTTAADGRQGLELLQARPAEAFDLLITDVGLPGGLNGRQVADAARLRHPGLRVLFITGYADGVAVSGGQLDAGMEVMTKPFELRLFKQRLARMLADRAARAAGGPTARH